ncbi:MAG: hypothetical protein ACREC6_09880 [Hyphomicrobiaceae bacterium]
MNEISNDAIYDALRQVQPHLVQLQESRRRIHEELVIIRQHMMAMQRDIGNIYGRLNNLEDRLVRVERQNDIGGSGV